MTADSNGPASSQDYYMARSWTVRMVRLAIVEHFEIAFSCCCRTGIRAFSQATGWIFFALKGNRTFPEVTKTRVVF